MPPSVAGRRHRRTDGVRDTASRVVPSTTIRGRLPTLIRFESVLLAAVVCSSFVVVGLACLLQPERMRAWILKRNRGIRNWPIYGYIGYEMVQKPWYAVVLRLQGTVFTLVGVAIFVLLFGATRT